MPTGRSCSSRCRAAAGTRSRGRSSDGVAAPGLRLKGRAYLPVETKPIMFGTHGDVREHYGTAPGQYPEHATTLDYVVAATAG
ncbi:MAG: hypothetical protein E6I12_10025 [Chloroflexi bacterium]|nr:MAG: hypothetical protein E6I12_10025 [Chloroflexota bacterium]